MQKKSVPCKGDGENEGNWLKIFAIAGKIRIFAVPKSEMADELQKWQARCPPAYGPKL